MSGTGRRTRRAVVGTGAGGAAASLLAGCGIASGAGRGGEGPRSASEPVRLTWMFRPDLKPELIRWGIDRFRQQHPNATVETLLAPNSVADGLAQIFTRAAAGETPDVLWGTSATLWPVVGRGLVANHADLVKDLKRADVDDFVAYQWQAFVVPGTTFRWGLPSDSSLNFLAYNRSLFRQRGQREPHGDMTHDEYTEMLRRMTFVRPTETGDQRVWGGFTSATVAAPLHARVFSFGGSIVDPKDVTRSALQDPRTQQAFAWLHQRLWRDESLGPVDPARQPWRGLTAGFTGGFLATQEAGTNALEALAQGMAGVEWNITPMPRGPSSGRQPGRKRATRWRKPRGSAGPPGTRCGRP